MTCPDCGHDNLAGVDACEHCGQDLRSIDIPRPKSGLQRAIMKTALRDLDPLPALTVPPGEPIAAAIRLMQKERQGSVMVVEEGRLVGIFTEQDALTRLVGTDTDLDKTPVTDITQFDQNLPDRSPVFLLDIERFGNLGAVDPLHLDQDAAELSTLELLDGR